MPHRLSFPKIALLLTLTFVVATAVAFTVPSTEAAGCGPCLGPVRTAYGTGWATTCAAARQAAETQATINAFSGGSACIPCQGSLTSYCSDIVVCRPGQGGCNKLAHATYTYKCKSCGPF